MSTVSAETKPDHSHDVEIFWEFWPFSVIYTRGFKEFLTGYGLNWLNTYLFDISIVPMAIWNSFWWFFGFNPFNWFWDFWNGFANWFQVWFNWVPFWLFGLPTYILRFLIGAPGNETFGWLVLLASLSGGFIALGIDGEAANADKGFVPGEGGLPGYSPLLKTFEQGPMFKMTYDQNTALLKFDATVPVD